MGAVIALLGPTLPGLAEQVGKKVPDLGLLFSTRSFGYLLGSLLAGWVLDRVRGHPLMMAVLAVVGLLLLLVPRLTFLPILEIVLFMIGLGLGSIDVSSNTLLAKVHKEQSGPYLNAMYLAAGMGSFLIPLFLGNVSLTSGYTGLSILISPLILWLVTTPSPPVPERIYGDDLGQMDIGVVILFAMMAFLFVGLEVSYGGWIFTYFEERGLGPEGSAYTLTSLFGVAITIGRLVAIPTAAHVQPTHAISIYVAAGILSTGLILTFKGPAWPVWVRTGGIGLSLAALFPTTFNYIQRTNKLDSRWNGIVWSMGSAGGITLPLIIGWGMRAHGPSSMMIVVLLTWLLSSGTFFTLMQKNQDL